MNAAISERITTSPPAPSALSAHAKAEWRNLMPEVISLGLLRRADFRSFQIVCELLGACTELQAQIRKEGFTITSKTGERLNPKVRALEGARLAALKALGEVGVTPKAKHYVPAVPAPKRSRLDAIEDGL